MRKNCKNFLEWAQSQFDEFPIDKSEHLRVDTICTPNSVITTITNNRTGKTGHATVKTDNFNDPTMIAIALAWTNYKGEEIPDFKISLIRLSTNDRFYYHGKKYIYLTSNPYAKDQILVCDMEGKPYNMSYDTRVSLEPQ